MTVEVRDRDRDARIAAVVKLASHGNKDREETRRGFAAKTVSYLRINAGVMVIDVVASRTATLHNKIVTLLGLSESSRLDTPSGLSVVSYQLSRQEERSIVQTWFEPLTLNASLLTMPLCIRGLGAIAMDLEATYMEACQRSRLS